MYNNLLVSHFMSYCMCRSNAVIFINTATSRSLAHATDMRYTQGTTWSIIRSTDIFSER